MSLHPLWSLDFFGKNGKKGRRRPSKTFESEYKKIYEVFEANRRLG